MSQALTYVPERLDHLGIVAGVCQEIGLAAYLDALDTSYHARVSVGTATVAMILNGLGFSNRRLYLIPQFFADKPVETLLGPGITANELNDECLGRTLDWLYAHDPTALFAGIATQARRVFSITARQIHVDTTSFSVSGEYLPEEGDLDANVIAITYGYSRDHRADLKQWMLALGTTHEGDIPLFLRPLDGNSSDQRTLLSAVQALAEQLRTPEGEEERIYIADGGVYSSANMGQLNAAGIRWESRVPETSAQAKAALARTDVNWQRTEDGEIAWWSQEITLPHGQERWVIVRTKSGEQRAKATLQRKVEAASQTWKQKVWHLSNQRFACEADARAALERELRQCPTWFEVQTQVGASPKYAQSGRPRKDATPRTTEWQIQVTLAVNQERVEAEALRAACFIVGTNVLDPTRLSDQEVVTTYKAQGGVERGFRFLKDPLFLASSVFLKKPERIMALSLIMVLCLLVYRLAEHRLRSRLVKTGQTIPDQLRQPTNHPTLRWVFQCFEVIELLQISTSSMARQTLVLRLEPLHEQILALLGPLAHHYYQPRT